MIKKPHCILIVFSLVVGGVSGQIVSSKGSVGAGSLIDVPPTVVIRCPDRPPLEGEPITFYADSAKLPRASYKWKVSLGRIIKGQGSRTVTVDTNGAGGKKLKASVEMNDGHNHLTMTYCEIDVKLRNAE